MTANNINLLDEFRSPSLSPSLLQSLLHRLLSHPKIFNGYVDILKLPSVQETLGKMTDEQRAMLVRTVELFAYGTVKDYYALKEKKGSEEVWALNDAQLEKLRMLSVASIAREQIDRFHYCGGGGTAVSSSSSSGDVEMTDDATTTAKPKSSSKSSKKGKKNKNKKKNKEGMLSIPYSHLASELHLPNNDDSYDETKHMRQLEDLLIQCIYSNIIAAKLDQSSKSLRIEPQLALTHEPAAGVVGGGRKVGSKKATSSGGVYGSVFSRDLNTTTPESTNVEVSRMISSLQQFLKQSNTLLSTLEHSSKVLASDRTEDEIRWKEVQKMIGESPNKFREGGGGGGSSLSASGGGGHGGMGGVMGMGGMTMGGGEPMEVVDMAGRRQVKRSKGGHSMMQGGVRFG
ncbi:hypothetical protein ACHAXR_007519 [Thalassiosira sp. AJA248-18]